MMVIFCPGTDSVTMSEHVGVANTVTDGRVSVVYTTSLSTNSLGLRSLALRSILFPGGCKVLVIVTVPLGGPVTVWVLKIVVWHPSIVVVPLYSVIVLVDVASTACGSTNWVTVTFSTAPVVTIVQMPTVVVRVVNGIVVISVVRALGTGVLRLSEPFALRVIVIVVIWVDEKNSKVVVSAHPSSVVNEVP